MAGKIPTEAEVLGYFKSLSNWGRWGDDDQLGTLNHVSPEKTVQATRLVQEGVAISCAQTIRYEPAPDVPFPPLHYMVESGEGWASGDKVSSMTTAGSMEFFGLIFHAYGITHLDSLAHLFWEGKVYNGRPAHLVSTNLGATVGSVEQMKDSIVTRGVLVDVPWLRGIDWVERGEGVMPDDILAAEERCGFRVDEGDVLLVRTGQHRRRDVEGAVDPWVAGSTACQAACLPLFHQRGIAVLGSDTGNEVIPSPYPKVSSPIHQVGIVSLGLWLLDCTDLEELARACRQRNRWEFLISISPLRIYNGTGSPVNPVAVL